MSGLSSQNLSLAHNPTMRQTIINEVGRTTLAQIEPVDTSGGAALRLAALRSQQRDRMLFTGAPPVGCSRIRWPQVHSARVPVERRWPALRAADWCRACAPRQTPPSHDWQTMTFTPTGPVPEHLQNLVSALIVAFDTQLDTRYAAAYSDYVAGALAIELVIIDKATGFYAPITVNAGQGLTGILSTVDEDDELRHAVKELRWWETQHTTELRP